MGIFPYVILSVSVHGYYFPEIPTDGNTTLLTMYATICINPQGAILARYWYILWAGPTKYVLRCEYQIKDPCAVGYEALCNWSRCLCVVSAGFGPSECDVSLAVTLAGEWGCLWCDISRWQCPRGGKMDILHIKIDFCDVTNYTGSCRNTWRFCNTALSGIDVGNLSLSALLARLKAL